MNRRAFLAALAGLPLVGRLFQLGLPNANLGTSLVRRIGEPVLGHTSQLDLGEPVGGYRRWEYRCTFCGVTHAASVADEQTVFHPGTEVERRWLSTPCPARNIGCSVEQGGPQRRITQKDKDAALCSMGIHEWRSDSEVYRRHLGFAEVDGIRCCHCKVHVDVAPSHRDTRPGWWLEGDKDGGLRAVAGPVYPVES